jgi:chromosome segregation ATPase
MQEFRIDSSQRSQLSKIQSYNLAYTLNSYEKSEPVFIKKATFGSDEIKYNHPGLKKLMYNYTIPTQVAILSDLYKFKLFGTKPEKNYFQEIMALEELEDLTPKHIAQFFSIHMSFTNQTTHKHATDEIYREHFIRQKLYLIPEIYQTVRATLMAPEHTKRANNFLDKLVEKLNSDMETQVSAKISTELQRANHDVSSLQEELAQSRNYIGQLEEKIEELKATHNRKSGEFEIARNELKEISRSRKNSGAELERTEKEINIARSRIEDFAELELEDPSLQEELVQAREEHQSLLSEHEDLLIQINRLDRQYNLAASNVSNLEIQVSRIKLELTSAKRTKEKAERDILDLCKRLESESLKHKRKIIDLEEKYVKTTKESSTKAKLRLLELEENNQTMLKEIERLSLIEQQYNQMVKAQSQIKQIKLSKEE